jgi:hypothetical protein
MLSALIIEQLLKVSRFNSVSFLNESRKSLCTVATSVFVALSDMVILRKETSWSLDMDGLE